MTPLRQLKPRRKRSIIFWIFILVAGPLTVLILSYAAGYKFDRQTGTIIATSLLSIKTTPAEATVFFNGKKQEPLTPYIYTDILPGTYTITIRKSGYQPWKKHLTIEQGKSMLFNDVMLFLDHTTTTPIDAQAMPETVSREELSSLPQDLLASYAKEGFAHPEALKSVEGPRDILVDPQTHVSYIVPSLKTFIDTDAVEREMEHTDWNEHLLVYTSQSDLWLYNSHDDTHTLLTRHGEPMLDAVIHPAGQYVFFSAQDGIYAIEIDNKDHRQTWKLADASSASNLRVTKTGAQLLFTSNDKTKSISLYND
ncbi:MAG: PEGA domain-containing protein [Candidatus Kerfeldbacteria bacterium]|nr:PEGA domain-containing protein [Candidatus Kerfeldbacteria bacterium]